MDAYENLANAVILKAVKDYRYALRKLQRNPHYFMAKNTKAECERFFRSKWFRLLTSIDGEMLIQKLQEEVVL